MPATAANTPSHEPPAPCLAYRAYRLGFPERQARAFAVARDWYARGRKLDMRALASELGVSRPTLYRWVGSRERLLEDVIWSFAEELLAVAVRRARGDGSARIMSILREFTAQIVAAPALRRFLEMDAEIALRVLTRRDGGVEGRLVRAVAELLDDEVRASGLSLPLETPEMAYLIVRVVEAFLYNDAIAALEPDLEAAAMVVELLLKGAQPSAGTTLSQVQQPLSAGR